MITSGFATEEHRKIKPVFHGNIFQILSVAYTYIRTYIRYWPLQPFSQDYGLVSNNTHVVFVNFICEWWNLQFKVDSERQIFEQLFHGRLILFTFGVFVRNLL